MQGHPDSRNNVVGNYTWPVTRKQALPVGGESKGLIPFLNEQLGELKTATEKARRDASSIAVYEV